MAQVPKDIEKKIDQHATKVLTRMGFEPLVGPHAIAVIAFLEAAVILVLTLFLILYANFHEPKDHHYAVYGDGKETKILPTLAKPNMDQTAILAWAVRAATDVMTFGFHNAQARFDTVGELYFTKAGLVSFQDALERSQLLQNVFDKKQVVTAVPRGVPVITRQGMLLGSYTWVVQVPLNINYQSGPSISSSPRLITLWIVTRPTSENPRGIGVDAWTEQGM